MRINGELFVVVMSHSPKSGNGAQQAMYPRRGSRKFTRTRMQRERVSCGKQSLPKGNPRARTLSYPAHP